jgi:hypothetical protein
LIEQTDESITVLDGAVKRVRNGGIDSASGAAVDGRPRGALVSILYSFGDSAGPASASA